jgi:hypothetical protein
MSEFMIVELDNRLEFGMAVIDDDVLMTQDNPTLCCNSNAGCTNHVDCDCPRCPKS